MPTLKVIQMELGSMANFNYLIADTATGEAAVIDPNEHYKDLQAIAKKNAWTITKVLLTHGHYDHVGGADPLAKELNIPVLLSDKEAFFYVPLCKNLTRTKDQEKILLGKTEILCLQTPGHTPGGQCFLADGNLFTGDVLFIDAIGRTDLPGGDAPTLFKSLEKIKTLPENTIIWSGHNYGAVPHATLGALKKSNPYLICQTLEDFLNIN